MRRLITSTFAALALVVLVTGGVSADDKEQSSSGGTPSPEEMQKLMEAFAKPGKAHQQYKRLVGKWKTDAKDFYSNPEDPVKTQGSATFRLLMGGRYLQQRFQGEFAGEKFVGMGIQGYDNSTKSHISVWIDNMGTGILQGKGKYDPQQHKLIETGVGSSPVGPMKFKMVTHYQSDDKFTLTMFMVTDEGEQKTMEVTYSRDTSSE